MLEVRKYGKSWEGKWKDQCWSYRSNGLEDTQGGLKSLMEVRGPDEGHAEGQTRPGVSNPGLLLDDAMVHPGRGFSPSKSLGQSWTLSWGLAVPGPAWDSR